MVNLWHQSTAINGEMFNVIHTLFTRLCYSHPVHTLFTQTGSASLKLQSNLIRKVSSPVLQISSEQTIGRRTTCKRLGHHGRIRAQSPIPKMESENWHGCFGKGECRCRGRSLLPCCAGCFEPLSGKASSDLSSGSYSVGPMLRPGAQDLRRSVREVCRSRFGRSMARR